MDEDASINPAVEEAANGISSMRIRGAATIADAVADAIATQATESDASTVDELRAELQTAAAWLHDTRPTAVSLANALRTVLQPLERNEEIEQLRNAVVDRSESFRTELSEAQDQLGRIGANRLQDGDTVLTQCHSTAVTACLERAADQGLDIDAVVTETRPRRQGYITARELDDIGLDVTLVVDGAAASYLDRADHVLVGADSIAADGTVVNKVGTASLAAVASDRRVPVVCHASTIKLHPETLSGHTIPIEYRDPEEVLADPGAEGLENVTVENPAFDVTPPRHVDAIVTERGQFPPDAIVTLMRERFGESVTQPWE